MEIKHTRLCNFVVPEELYVKVKGLLGIPEDDTSSVFDNAINMALMYLEDNYALSINECMWEIVYKLDLCEYNTFRSLKLRYNTTEIHEVIINGVHIEDYSLKDSCIYFCNKPKIQFNECYGKYDIYVRYTTNSLNNLDALAGLIRNLVLNYISCGGFAIQLSDVISVSILNNLETWND